MQVWKRSHHAEWESPDVPMRIVVQASRGIIDVGLYFVEVAMKAICYYSQSKTLNLGVRCLWMGIVIGEIGTMVGLSGAAKIAYI